jgi:hypothetical protein
MPSKQEIYTKFNLFLIYCLIKSYIIFSSILGNNDIIRTETIAELDCSF